MEGLGHGLGSPWARASKWRFRGLPHVVREHGVEIWTMVAKVTTGVQHILGPMSSGGFKIKRYAHHGEP